MLKKTMISLAVALMAVPAALAQQAPADDGMESAVFAGGCFWCVEEAFDKVEGVTETVSGFSGGTVPDPSYEQVTQGGTGHAEAVRVTYDPAEVDYAALLDVFWRNVDPFDGGGQFCDRGPSYRSVVFVENPEERRLAEETKQSIAERFDRPVETEITEASEFYPAEDYHQNYHQENPLRYKYYKWACGREQRLEEIWGPPEA
ncbi:peptide-methionine (S)-S-oxide reductase MsrA [Inquilinus sp. CAU 1745]|uniref:peptide-methionine (S)-S-oxide reductase MsrA n=1 Tax=Inquilinus sp. CAU 1745 TaxID=3140369 RepID=UPI00325B7A81